MKFFGVKFFLNFFVYCFLRLVFLQLHMLLIHPTKLDFVKNRSAFLDFGKVKIFNQFIKRKNFLVRAGIPAEKSKIIENCFGQIAEFAILKSRNSAGALGKFFLAWVGLR